MKLKTRKNRKHKALRPSRIDPTRTSGLRRSFVAALRRQFSSLKADILRHVADGDAFGLKNRPMFAASLVTVNAFCPTGPGGGIDNSCSPGTGSQPVAVEISRLATLSREELKSHPEAKMEYRENLGHKNVIAYWDDNSHKLYVGDSYFEHSAEDRLDIVAHEIGHGLVSKYSKDVELSQKVFFPMVESGVLGKWDDVKGKFVGFSGQRTPDEALADLAKDYLLRPEILSKHRPKQYEAIRSLLEVTANAFCPTGEGGGIDNSCSPSGRSPVEFGQSVHEQYPNAPKTNITDKQFKDTYDALKKAGRINSDGTITLYHDTLRDPETVKSIQEKGFVPAYSAAAGQPWVATHSAYATYFHVDKIGARGLLETAEDEFLTTVKVRVPFTKEFLSRVVPDEDANLDKSKGPETLAEGSAIGIIGGVPSKYVEGGVKPPKAQPESLPKGGGYKGHTFHKVQGTTRIKNKQGKIVHRIVGGVTEAKTWVDQYTTNAFNPDQPRDEQGRWTSEGVVSHDSWKSLEADPSYFYHATSEENARGIADSHLVGHGPSFGTDQGTWPDGSTSKRIYFTDKPSTAWQFAPEHGKPALLRIKRTPKFKKESGTGDLYREGVKIKPHALEVLTELGWKKLAERLTANVSRDHMPQVRKADWEEFLTYARERTTVTREDGVDPSSLKAIQHEFSQERVDQIPMEKLQYPILVSREGYVLDGNHRWIKAHQTGTAIPVLRLGLDKDDALAMMRTFPQVEFVGNSFDPSQPRDEKGQWSESGSSPHTDTKEFKEWFGKSKVVSKAGTPLVVYHGATQDFESFNEGHSFFSNKVSVAESFAKSRAEHAGEDNPKPRLVAAHVRIEKPFVIDAKGARAGNIQFASRDAYGYRAALDSSDYDGVIIKGTEDEGDLYIPKSPLQIKSVNNSGKFSKKSTSVYNAEEYAYASDPDKVKLFEEWLKTRFNSYLIAQSNENLWKTYIQEGYLRGMGRAFDDANQARRAALPITDPRSGTARLDRTIRTQRKAFTALPGSPSPIQRAFYEGTREEFLRSSFGRPVGEEKVRLLAGRSFDELKDVTREMSNKISRVLVDGLVVGNNPRTIAREMVKQVELSFQRATTIARTEIIRAHANGQLEAFRNLGIQRVGAAVEWSVTRTLDGTPDERVCCQCVPLNGIVLSLDEAMGLIPRHPNCRCAWTPANVGENPKNQKRTHAQIVAALRASVACRKVKVKPGEKGWAEDTTISETRPKSLVGVINRGSMVDQLIQFESLSSNVFCPTGEGGGIDPTCSPPGGPRGTWKDRSGQLDRMTKRELAGHVSRLSGRGNEGTNEYMSLSRATLMGAVELHERPRYAVETQSSYEWINTYFESDKDFDPHGRKRPVYNPDVDNDSNGDGVTDQARVGVPAHSVPPPPPIARLPNLTPHERAVEDAFIRHYEADPEGVAQQFRQVLSKTTPPGVAKTFGTDDSKELADAWSHPDQNTRLENRARLNLALHQTANAITKRAFLQELDTIPPGGEVLVTVGGCGAGKGYALKNVPQALELKKSAAVIWDSAGDQNATENPWIQKEAEARGLKVNYVYVHAHPETQWAHPEKGVVKRASDVKDGRMVDAKVFADSYALGAKNHAEFARRNANNPNARFLYLDNNGKPELLSSMPKEALKVDRHKLYKFASETVKKMDVPKRVKAGATNGERIWAAGS
jgi:SPP1 gp7 family putative phage head morphogenesis protein